MTISVEHAEAMRLGRERRIAEDEARAAARRSAFSAWIKADARLWRVYKALDGKAADGAYREWKRNLDAMPVLP